MYKPSPFQPTQLSQSTPATFQPGSQSQLHQQTPAVPQYQQTPQTAMPPMGPPARQGQPTPQNLPSLANLSIEEAFKAGDYKPPPEGVYAAFIVGFSNKGMQLRSYQGSPPKEKHVIQVFFAWDEYTQGQEMTYNLSNAKAKLRKTACAALGVQAITPEVFPNAAVLLGRPVTIEVTHYDAEKDGMKSRRASIPTVLRPTSTPVLAPNYQFPRATVDFYMRNYGNLDLVPGLPIAPPANRQ